MCSRLGERWGMGSLRGKCCPGRSLPRKGTASRPRLLPCASLTPLPYLAQHGAWLPLGVAGASGGGSAAPSAPGQRGSAGSCPWPASGSPARAQPPPRRGGQQGQKQWRSSGAGRPGGAAAAVRFSSLQAPTLDRRSGSITRASEGAWQEGVKRGRSPDPSGLGEGLPLSLQPLVRPTANTRRKPQQGLASQLWTSGHPAGRKEAAGLCHLGGEQEPHPPLGAAGAPTCTGALRLLIAISAPPERRLSSATVPVTPRTEPSGNGLPTKLTI